MDSDLPAKIFASREGTVSGRAAVESITLRIWSTILNWISSKGSGTASA